MIYTEEIDLQTTVTRLCDQRDHDVKTILKIVELVKSLNNNPYKLSELIRFPDNISESKLEEIRKMVDSHYWSSALDICQIEKFTTSEDKEKIRDRFNEEPKIFDKDNVNDVMNGFMNSTDAIATNMIKKVFERITQLHFRTGNKHKNKLQHKNNEKIEKSFRCSLFYSEIPSYIHSRSGNFDLIDDLERACYLVAGESQPDRQKCIRSIVDEGLRQGLLEFENNYFTIRLFKNGNAKVDFKDDEILARLNSWGSSGNKVFYKNVG